MKYTYEELSRKYGAFGQPGIHIICEGKSFDENEDGLIIGEAEIELTSGFEASQAVYRIFGCTDSTTGEFLFEKMKPYILLGSLVSVELGYGDELEEVFRGFIARVQFVSDENEFPYTEVNVMDIKGVMMLFGRGGGLQSVNYGDAIKEILGAEIYRGMEEKGLLEKKRISAGPEKDAGQEQEEQKLEVLWESDYDFAVNGAKKYNYEFFTEPGAVIFRKAGEGAGELLTLEPGRGIVSFSASYDIRGIVREIEIRGADSETGGLITAVKKCSGKFSYGNRTESLLAHSRRVCLDASLSGKTEAAVRADALAGQMASGFGRLECDCIGIPELKPGNYVALHGFGQGADNKYYITQVRHILSEEQGYITRLTGQAGSVQ